jgi:hypothetical protein
MTQSADSITYKRVPDIPGAYVGDALLMLSVEQGQYFSLNGVGARVWDLIETPATLPVLVDTLIGEYEVNREACAGEVRRFLDELRRYGLLAAS